MILNVYKTSRRVIITILVSFVEMQRRVKEETSHIALRAKDKEGNPLYEDYVLDEAYETKFRTLFKTAQGEITLNLSAYLNNVPSEPEIEDTSESVDGDDFILLLPMPPSYSHSLSNSLGVKIDDYFESYIMYSWLLSKDSQMAEIYFARSEKLKSEINTVVNIRSQGVKRPNRYW